MSYNVGSWTSERTRGKRKKLARSKVVFLDRDRGEIQCTSKLPRRCARKVGLWPSTVRCVLTTYHGLKSIDQCRPLGTGRTLYKIQGHCNSSNLPECVATFDVDATLDAMGWNWHWVLLGCIGFVLLMWFWNWTVYRHQWQRRLFY